jgi:hypothetical protein
MGATPHDFRSFSPFPKNKNHIMSSTNTDNDEDNTAPPATDVSDNVPPGGDNDGSALEDQEDVPAEDSLPLYLVRTISRARETINMDEVLEDMQEEGFGDSDNEADDVLDHDDAMIAALAERRDIAAVEEEETVEFSDRNAILLQKGATVPALKLPGPPTNWLAPSRKVAKGEPLFLDVDNPGGWDEFTYRPEFSPKGEKQYVRHVLPTGASPVPEVDGKRAVGPWEFFYGGWKDMGDNGFRDGASKAEPFPESRRGKLDEHLLSQLGLTTERMTSCDALFFYQLLLPMCDPTKSGITNDPRKGFYSKVEGFTNSYAYSIGLGGSYGHRFKSIDLNELVHFDGVVVRDGVRGGSNGALYRRWMHGADQDELIAESMHHCRWLQIKRVIKLCNNETAPKRGEPGYDPAYKYDMIYKVLIDNLNAITEEAELDLSGDETTWGHGGFGEAGSGLIGRILNKPGVTKGGQIVMISDVHRIRPRAYMHRHKLHVKPPGWTQQGPYEVKSLLETLNGLVQGEPAADGRRQIFKKKPHSTWDNFFSGDQICDHAGANGFGMTMTCRRDRLPNGIPAENMCKKKTSNEARPKAARFNQPINLVKIVPPDEAANRKGYVRVHTTFQSTSSCNISTVNALNECGMYVRKRERGRGENKRCWGIEMNDARELYLGTYSRIDSIDHLIKNANIFYRSWKYWHSPMLHGKSLAVVVAYDLYLEVAEGKLNPAWGIEEPLDFWTFREKLSIQMLEYSPTRKKYPGDAVMRASTQQSRRQRVAAHDYSVRRRVGRPSQAGAAVPVAASAAATPSNGVTMAHLSRASSSRDSRLCGDLTRLKRHLDSIVTGKHHGKKCVVCGEVSYSTCKLCGDKPLHFFPKNGKNVGKACFFDYHSDSFFGLAADDSRNVGNASARWTPPSQTKRKRNAREIAILKSGDSNSESSPMNTEAV